MYRNNMSRGMSHQTRLDPRLLERIALRSEMPSDISEPCMCGRNNRNFENGCACNRNASENTRKNNGCGCGMTNQSNRKDDTDGGCDTICETYNAEFDYSLAMVYSPYQEFQNLYCEDDGFMTGTIFRELDKHFYGPRCHGGNCNE